MPHNLKNAIYMQSNIKLKAGKAIVLNEREREFQSKLE